MKTTKIPAYGNIAVYGTMALSICYTLTCL